MSLWIVIVPLSALTYALRASFLLGARHPLPTAWLHALRVTPPAVLAAFVVPTLLGSGNLLAPGAISALLAAGVAALVAWHFQNVWLTVVTGMVTLWIFQAWL